MIAGPELFWRTDATIIYSSWAPAPGPFEILEGARREHAPSSTGLSSANICFEDPICRPVELLLPPDKGSEYDFR